MTMSPLGLAFALVAAAAVLPVTAVNVGSGAAGIVLAPLAGRTGPPKLLVLVHGASINEAHYQSISLEIQRASQLNLWVGLPHFLADTPNPITITSAVTGMVARIAAQGKFTAKKEDVFVAGHSLGGVFAPAVVNAQGYGALLEFGSYVTNGLDISTTPFPVLTLGGELDGLTRATRMALEYAKMLNLSTPAQRLRKPVVLLPGVCHSQFCEGVNVTSFGIHDLLPDVTWPQAHAAIAAVSAQFLDLVVGTDVSAMSTARAAFAQHFNYTHQLLHGFLAAREAEEADPRENWCTHVQRTTVAPPQAQGPAALLSAARSLSATARGGTVPDYAMQLRSISNEAELATAHPSLEAGPQPVVHVVSFADFRLNPIDVSTVPVAAKSLTCEMMSADAIALASKQPGAGGKTPPTELCKQANDAAIALAAALVSPRTLQRFQQKGQTLLTTADKVTTSGPAFLASFLGFSPRSGSSPSGRVAVVQGVSLATSTSAGIFPGVQQCVLLSPARAIEWMLTDGLPKLP